MTAPQPGMPLGDAPTMAPEASTQAGEPSPSGDRAPASAYPRGSTLGRYVILERVGAGGMGVVYAAYDPQLDRRVAIKLVRAADDPETSAPARDRLLREAQAMAQLGHPNLVAVFDAGTAGDEVFLAMEFVDGQTLAQWLAGEPRQPRAVIDAFVQAGDGLAAAHAAGLVHRDFKPDNAFVRADGRVQVGDFGLARALGRGAGPRDAAAQPADAGAQTHGVVGTPAFMPPEQRDGRPADARSDVFSFCVALSWALYGVHPFDDGRVAIGVATAVGNPAVIRRDGRVERTVRDALLRGLELDPERRWPAMAPLLAVLRVDTARRRRRIAGGIVGVASVAAAVGFAVQAAAPADPCASIEPRLAEVWGDPVRAEVEAVVRAAATPRAEETWEVVRRELDGHAAHWRDGYTASCRATRDGGGLEPAVYERRAHCYGVRLDTLAATVDVLRSPDPIPLERMVLMVTALPEPRSCDAIADDADRGAAPEREVAGRMRRDLARAAALRSARRGADAQVLAAAVQAEAHAVGATGIEAAATLEVGRNQAASESATTIRAAVAQAILAGDDELAADAWLAYLAELTDVGDLDGATAITGIVEAAVHRAPTDANAWMLQNNLGNLAFARRDFVAAEKVYRDAIDLLVAAGDVSSSRMATAVANLGAALGEQGRVAEAIASLQEAVALREALYGPTHPSLAGSLDGLALALLHEGRLDAAWATAQRVVSLEEQLRGADARDEGLAAARMRRAHIEGLRGEHRAAIASIDAVLGRTLPAGVPAEWARALEIRGVAHEALGERVGARADHLAALGLRSAVLGPRDRAVGSSLYNLARLAWDDGMRDEARELGGGALAIQRAALGPEHPLTVETADLLAAIDRGASGRTGPRTGTPPTAVAPIRAVSPGL
jgi:tetratricopeptide (TPR) repeat protein